MLPSPFPRYWVQNQTFWKQVNELSGGEGEKVKRNDPSTKLGERGATFSPAVPPKGSNWHLEGGEEMFSPSSSNSAAIEGIFLSAFRHVETKK